MHQLKEGLDKLGPVNLEAVEELDAISERLGFLLEQEASIAAYEESHQPRVATQGTV